MLFPPVNAYPRACLENYYGGPQSVARMEAAACRSLSFSAAWPAAPFGREDPLLKGGKQTSADVRQIASPSYDRNNEYCRSGWHPDLLLAEMEILRNMWYDQVDYHRRRRNV